VILRDNTAVYHRAAGGSFEGKFVRVSRQEKVRLLNLKEISDVFCRTSVGRPSMMTAVLPGV